MYTSENKFVTFLNTLRNVENRDLLECIEKGFRNVFEGINLGSQNQHQINPMIDPKGDVVGNGVPGPASMCNETSETSDPPEKEEVHDCAVDNQGLCHTCGKLMDEDAYYIYLHGEKKWKKRQ